MLHSLAPNPTVSDRQQTTPNASGAAQGVPVQRRLRGVIGESYEDAGNYIHAALWEDLDSTGFSDDELADRTTVSSAQLSRIRSGQAHPPPKLVTWAIDNTRHRPSHYVVAVCTVADGEFKPKPPPSVDALHEATLTVLHEMGIDAVVRDKVARMLGVAR